MGFDSDGVMRLGDPVYQKNRYGQLMQLLSLAWVAVCIAILLLAILVKAQLNVFIFSIATFLIYLLLFGAFRTGVVKAGFYGFFYLSCINGLVGNTFFGWKSGIFILLFLLLPSIFYNPMLNKRTKIIFGSLLGFIVLVTMILGFFTVPLFYLKALQQQVLNGFNIFVTCLVLVGISFLDFRNSRAVARYLFELNDRLAYQASRDPLTNLLNRRTITQFIEEEYVRSGRSGRPFGLIMTDVDDFKRVNDQHGHAAGDLVLMELSSLLTAALRKQDLIARWGGEEFLILLPETDYEGVQVAAEKIRNLVSQNVVVYNGKQIQVTFSIGGVVCQNQENWDKCIILADRALYYGKNHGKNLAVFAKGDLYCVLGNPQEAIFQ